jgi:hypothetical protein
MFNGSKMFSFRWSSHVQEVILLKNKIETHLVFFKIFYVFGYKPNYSYIIMYECENSPPSHELF